MSTVKKVTGYAVAAAAATLFATAPMTASAADEGAVEVACLGVNACKGKSACKTADNACAGMNSCKGKGMVKMSAEECAEKGGKAPETE
ncbi:MAG: hypothetical protein DSZ32_02350 [Gammaproteobacteria bacterium]|nr:MAG: hypothetical protein DSZ32_02350 [Gammaproteobacteria bacterium]